MLYSLGNLGLKLSPFARQNKKIALYECKILFLILKPLVMKFSSSFPQFFTALFFLLLTSCASLKDDPHDVEAFVQLPLPEASAIHSIDQTFFIGAKTLNDINDILTPALISAGFDIGEKLRYFGLRNREGQINGYAIFTFIEEISEEGGRLRWYDGGNRGFWPSSLREILYRLRFSDDGYFRFFVFLVTDEAQLTDPDQSQLTRAEIMRKYSRGLRSFKYLPSEISSIPISENTDCTVLVYEFVNRQASGLVEITSPIRLEGKVHLIKTGLLQLVEINP